MCSQLRRKKRIGSANSTSSDFAGAGGGSACETPIAPEARLAEPAANPKEFIEALHQNARTTQLYGKNNVFVQNVRAANLLLISVLYTRVRV